MAPPETRYARNGDVRIAYQVVGNGALDLILVQGLVSHLDLTWQDPAHARFCERLAQFSRLILFDKRGTGLSDRDAGVVGLEDRMDDVIAVMDAAGSSRAAMLGYSEGGMTSLLFAATYPQRIRALVLYGAFAHSPTRAWPADQVEYRLDLIRRAWGTPILPPSVAPSMASDQAFRRQWARFERQSASAATAAGLLRVNHEIDVSHVLPAVHVPTLLLHRSGDQRVGVEQGRYLAQRMPGAKYLELTGVDHLPYIGDGERVIAEIAEFLSTLADAAPSDRALATVLSASLADPPSHATELGDIVRQEIAQFRGRDLGRPSGEILAGFDGPARAIRCALAIGERARPFGVALRAGLHTGEIAASGEIADSSVAVAAELAQRAGPNEVIVSNAVRDIVAGSGLRFEERGAQAVAGVSEAMPLYAAFDD